MLRVFKIYSKEKLIELGGDCNTFCVYASGSNDAGQAMALEHANQIVKINDTDKEFDVSYPSWGIEFEIKKEENPEYFV